MIKEDYLAKMKEHLDNGGSYKRFKNNPMNWIMKKVSKEI